MRSTWRLSIGREDQGGVLVLRARGRIGVNGAAQLETALSAALDEGRRAVVLDLEGVDYVSSPGIIAIGESAERLARRGGVLTLRALCEPVRLVLDLSGLLANVAVADAGESPVRLPLGG